MADQYQTKLEVVWSISSKRRRAEDVYVQPTVDAGVNFEHDEL